MNAVFYILFFFVIQEICEDKHMKGVTNLLDLVALSIDGSRALEVLGEWHNLASVTQSCTYVWIHGLVPSG